MFILKCINCGKMYKAQQTEKGFITDFGDKIDRCFCGGYFHSIEADDWVVDKVFSCKGEKH